MKRVLYLILIMLTAVLVACGTNGGSQQESDGAQEENTAKDTMDDVEEKLPQNQDEADEEEVSNATKEPLDEIKEEQPLDPDTPEVLFELNDADGQLVATATIAESGNAVNIELEGTELPSGEHGFHIHENAACETPDFESAGGHFNPTDANHGFHDPDGPHAGDLDNIMVMEDGTVHTEVTADMVTLEKGEDNSLFKDGGSSLVIHADPDDNTSQPSGDAGERIACGVIEE